MHRFPRLHDALDYAAEAHNGQLRKKTQIPYLAHLLGVCALVLEYGGDEDQAIAGLLHDVVEDCGEKHLEAIRTQFGDKVAEIVDGCTDGVPDGSGQKPPWKDRKQAYLEHLRDAPDATLLVSACDKLYNARAIAADVRSIGRDVFERFNAGRDGSIWYYEELVGVFADRLGRETPLIIELRTAVADLQR